jgi:hypothetical protein
LGCSEGTKSSKKLHFSIPEEVNPCHHARRASQKNRTYGLPCVIKTEYEKVDLRLGEEVIE